MAIDTAAFETFLNERLGQAKRTSVDGLTVESDSILDIIKAYKELQSDTATDSTTTRPFRIQFMSGSRTVGRLPT